MNEALQEHHRLVPKLNAQSVPPANVSRRMFLRGAGVGLALPWLDRFDACARERDPKRLPQRTVMICTSLGIYGPNLFPAQTGRGFEETPYLQQLKPHLDDVTIYSGLSHPDQSGSDGHAGERTWLTAAPHPGLGGFRNTISMDQLVVEQLGYVTRFPSLVLGMDAGSQSFTRSGVMVPAVSSPSKLFADLFLEGTPDEVSQQVNRLRDGRSILDMIAGEAKRLDRGNNRRDQDRIDEYFQSVREMERRLADAQAWSTRPKPKVDATKPEDITNDRDLIGRMRLMFELIPLALQTDSTRVITMLIQGRSDVVEVPGVSIDHHNLSHHGQDPEKLAQLALVEQAEFRALQALLTSLKSKEEGGVRLLDNTSLIFGSNLGNANNHDTHNLPILVAGGGRTRGEHIAFDSTRNVPLSNLFLSLLHRQGIEVDRFGSSTGTLPLE